MFKARNGRGRISPAHLKAIQKPYGCTPVFLIYDFLADRRSSILGVRAAPGGRETFKKGGGRSPPPFWKVSRQPGAAQTPKINDIRSAKQSYSKEPREINCLSIGLRGRIFVQVDERGGPGRSRGVPGRPGPPRPPKIDDFRSVKKSYMRHPSVRGTSKAICAESQPETAKN